MDEEQLNRVSSAMLGRAYLAKNGELFFAIFSKSLALPDYKNRPMIDPSAFTRELLTKIDEQIFVPFFVAVALEVSNQKLDSTSIAITTWLKRSDLSQVRELGVFGSEIRGIPEEFPRCATSLTHFVMQHTLTQFLPLALLEWDQITFLDMAGNQLKAFPDLIPNSLPQLQELILNNNQLQMLPSMRVLQRLQKLDISLNQLAAGPELPDREIVLIEHGNPYSSKRMKRDE